MVVEERHQFLVTDEVRDTAFGSTGPARPGMIGWLRRIIRGWALAGGALLLLLAVATTWSAIGAALFGRPLPGEVELAELGVAIAAFSFLPYCQLIGANVSADIFTTGAGPRTVAVLKAISGMVAFGFALLLLWRMNAGLADYRRYEEITTILRIPIWIVFVPALASLALLAIASLISIRDAVAAVRRG
ncbi:MAG: TRAP transporter small permease [Burkholderiaceae bacterium]|jgi:TRAP-type C4-dicarboxylate transport system permease small subunit|nr:TRAP transporter small permease [Burkholderiaceae bacterium]MEB2317305.1 TRAP transporter small permease [Pseudomonadota bacterium]